MNRRIFLRTSAGAIALGATANFAQANESEEGLMVGSEISANHGHSVDLNLSDLVLLLRQADQDGFVEVDIQGASGHPHSIELEKDDIDQVLVQGTLSITSSTNAGHAHDVTINLS